jgi:hypothetical protein
MTRGNESSDDLTPLSDDDQLEKDMSYSPGSERETEEKQSDAEIDDEAVRVRPGTGGPDDVGDIEVDQADLNLPRDSGSH